MKAFQELTNWDTEFTVPNHVYFLNDSKEKMYGYVDSKGVVQTVRTPYRFHSKGRKFKEVANRWNFVVKEEEVVESTGKEYRVPGSKGAIYTVTDDAGAWSCTCPASKWQKAECKHIVALKQDQKV
jgi:SWIM zinc finger